jgi:Ca2+-transporting ATPase
MPSTNKTGRLQKRQTMKNWHQMDPEQALQEMESSALGLTAEEASQRLAHCGPNELEERVSKSPWRIWWEQLTATLVLILIAAAIISWWLC